MKCPACGVNEATIDKFLGVIPCRSCQIERAANKLTKPVEFTSQEIKNERIQFADDILQPFRQGELSKEYIEKHGYNNLSVTEEEVKKAKPVWR